jgi:ribosomal protein S18 acetylase RimI-like enzyme
VRPFGPGDAAAVIDLWEQCGLTRPWNDPAKDIARKVAHDDDLFLVAVAADELIGSVMAGYDGHRGWINYLAVAPVHHGRGVGTLMMADAELRLLNLGCPKVNLQIRNDNGAAEAFYNAIGYSNDEVTSFGKRLIADDG